MGTETKTPVQVLEAAIADALLKNRRAEFNAGMWCTGATHVTREDVNKLQEEAQEAAIDLWAAFYEAT